MNSQCESHIAVCIDSENADPGRILSDELPQSHCVPWSAPVGRVSGLVELVFLCEIVADMAWQASLSSVKGIVVQELMEHGAAQGHHVERRPDGAAAAKSGQAMFCVGGWIRELVCHRTRDD
jgi:hypothetical protein